MLILAKMQGCDIISLSLERPICTSHRLALQIFGLSGYLSDFSTKVRQALEHEKKLNYYVKDGRYWLNERLFAAMSCKKLDQIWIDALVPEAIN